MRKLMRARICRTETGARKFLSNRCFVQFIEVPDARERTFLEHYLIAAERPSFDD